MKKCIYPVIVSILMLLTSCISSQPTLGIIGIYLEADGKDIQLRVPSGSTVGQALTEADLTLGTLDRVVPPSYDILEEGSVVRITRVSEEFFVEEEQIPYERQVLQTESLPDQERLLVQNGENGLQEITYRRLFEDGIEVAKTPVQWVVVKEPVPEIFMVGVQTPFAPVSIPGRLVYLLGSNAWMMENTTGDRLPVVTTGDLDGHVLSLSPDGTWLLFTRTEEEEINSLWAAKISEDLEETNLFDLEINNVVHFAEWVPNENDLSIAYSTVESRSAPPGWQANNDLEVIKISESGWISQPETILEANSGGIYGWWGTDFTFETYGNRLVYSRPDSIGLVDLEEKSTQVIMDVVPFRTGGDWAWVPNTVWGADGNSLYTVKHVSPVGSTSPEESQLFDLTAVSIIGSAEINLVPQVGMFAYPVVSPIQSKGNIDESYKIAYLQATFPNQSGNSRYTLVIMDKDGSNRDTVFPDIGEPGLEPQEIVWSPIEMPDWDNYAVALIYQGNLWLIDETGNHSQQITGDGLTTHVTWKNFVE